MSPRPIGYDYSRPDPEYVRCPHCNQDGMNRTGLVAYAMIGTSTTNFWAYRCPKGCMNGLKHPLDAGAP